jgi:hypothetical protein
MVLEPLYRCIAAALVRLWRILNRSRRGGVGANHRKCHSQPAVSQEEWTAVPKSAKRHGAIYGNLQL